MTATASTEAATRADFSQIRYAQVWEDADILLSALDVASSDTVVSICSAGDNALALLGAGAGRVVALDLNPAQLACLELRVAAYRTLSHPELLVLIGSREGTPDERVELYQRCRPRISLPVQEFWDARRELIGAGIGSAGKFENYFRIFRTWVLPLVHGQKTVDALLRGGSLQERCKFYDAQWNTKRWQLLFRIFFSRHVMARLGRDPAFFHYVEGSVADRIMDRTEHALCALNPAENPYLHWILKGTHGEALPWALRAENFDAIRDHLDRLEWHQLSIEAFLDREASNSGIKPRIKFNLSDIFEYMSPENTERILARLASVSAPGGRLAYWNMLAPRRRPESLARQIQSREDIAAPLFLKDKAFFYSAFVVEDIL